MGIGVGMLEETVYDPRTGHPKRRPNRAIEVLTGTTQIVAALSGLILSTYTGVLLGATAIPAWNENVATLPIYFSAAGTAAAAATLELLGNDSPALNQIAAHSWRLICG